MGILLNLALYGIFAKMHYTAGRHSLEVSMGSAQTKGTQLRHGRLPAWFSLSVNESGILVDAHRATFDQGLSPPSSGYRYKETDYWLSWLFPWSDFSGESHSARAAALRDYLFQLSGLEVNTSGPSQLMVFTDLAPHPSKQSLALSVVLAPALTNWIRDQHAHTELTEVRQTMMLAARAMLGPDASLPGPQFKARASDGGVLLDCPNVQGDSRNPRLMLDRSNSSAALGRALSVTDLRHPAEQVTLLAGLAKLHMLAEAPAGDRQ